MAVGTGNDSVDDDLRHLWHNPFWQNDAPNKFPAGIFTGERTVDTGKSFWRPIPRGFGLPSKAPRLGNGADQIRHKETAETTRCRSNPAKQTAASNDESTQIRHMDRAETRTMPVKSSVTGTAKMTTMPSQLRRNRRRPRREADRSGRNPTYC
jgi:hypothetical protein